ncbi:hypothetical protein D8674_001057 [Pyrus ussuriensis x Pyrus communis]|uniref:Uncharacterized protein n=1 Tax=Pyrus ussuriensis x Pyrus communis TaxID=2448454 RepID=A0A5N5F596_9ROSA|nr:hypothetical protein D8674_001057 [Pyrus ussuriensis x Pyrus communis]
MENKGGGSKPVTRKGKGRDLTNCPPKRGLIKTKIFGFGGRSNQEYSSAEGGGAAAAATYDTNSGASPASANGHSSNEYE